MSVFVALAQELAPTHVEVVLDSAPAATDDFLLVEVLNIQHAGPRIHLSKRADPGDGLFDVVVATVGEREKLHYNLLTCLAGSMPDPILNSVKSRTVRLTFCDADFRIDDAVMHGPAATPTPGFPIEVEFGVVPGALQIITPGSPD